MPYGMYEGIMIMKGPAPAATLALLNEQLAAHKILGIYKRRLLAA